MEDIIVPVMVVGMLFIGLPWLILHHATKWKSASSLTREDEELLDSLYDTARRLEERLATIERIVAVDHPEFRAHSPAAPAFDPLSERRSN